MNYGTNLPIVVNGVTWPMAAIDGYSVTKRKLNAYAERTPKTMRIDQLGDVWEITYVLPAGLPETMFKTIADSLTPFVVNVQYYNPFTGNRRTDKFYHTDIKIDRKWRHIHDKVEITFIGTEVL